MAEVEQIKLTAEDLLERMRNHRKLLMLQLEESAIMLDRLSKILGLIDTYEGEK